MSSIGRRSCEIIMKDKTPLSHEVVCFQMLEFETSKSNSEVSKSNSNILVRNNFFLENNVTLEEAVPHNVLLSTSLHWSLTSKSYGNNYFEQLPIVSSVFNVFFWSAQITVLAVCWLSRPGRAIYFNPPDRLKRRMHQSWKWQNTL